MQDMDTPAATLATLDRANQLVSLSWQDVRMGAVDTMTAAGVQLHTGALAPGHTAAMRFVAWWALGVWRLTRHEPQACATLLRRCGAPTATGWAWRAEAVRALDTVDPVAALLALAANLRAAA